MSKAIYVVPLAFVAGLALKDHRTNNEVRRCIFRPGCTRSSHHDTPLLRRGSQMFEALVEKRVLQRLGEWQPPPLSVKVRADGCPTTVARCIVCPDARSPARTFRRRSVWLCLRTARPSWVTSDGSRRARATETKRPGSSAHRDEVLRTRPTYHHLLCYDGAALSRSPRICRRRCCFLLLVVADQPKRHRDLRRQPWRRSHGHVLLLLTAPVTASGAAATTSFLQCPAARAQA